MKALMLVLASSALCVAGCNRSDSIDANANVDVTTADNGLDGGAIAAPALPTTAPEFVNAAAASDKFEIDSSKLALTSGSSAAVKSFAQQIITGHTASTAKLNSALSAMSPPLVPNDTLNAEQQALIADLQGKTGTGFDTAYAAAQVAAHTKALDMLNAYAAGGDNPQLIAFAKGMIPTITAHLNLAKGLK